MKKLYVDVHALQSVVPSNLNRDDQGQPKSAIYGGVQRARVSSQAWKKQIREYFKENMNPDEVGIRTKHFLDLVKKEVAELAPELSEEAESLAQAALGLAGFKFKDGKSAVLVFLSPEQIKAVAELVVNEKEKFQQVASGKKDKEAAKRVLQALGQKYTTDMALFGRMVASDPSLNIDASCQVAHALSTHEAIIDYDYFTAVDDIQSEDEQGSAHLGDSPFISATLYRFATIDATALAKQIGIEPAVRSIELFLNGFVRTIPSGKQNSFSSHNLPFLVEVTLRQDTPVSYAAAFENPVRYENGFDEPSLKRLTQYKEKVEKLYGLEGKSFVSSLFDEEPLPVSEMIQQVGDQVRRDLENE